MQHQFLLSKARLTPMDILHVFSALVSALLHAGWNAAVKASPRPRAAMAAQLVVSGLIALPGLAWTGLPARASWIWIALSVTLNLVTLTALLRAYALIGFGAAYPVVRAISVVLVVPLAAHLSGEAMSPSGECGAERGAPRRAVLDRGSRDRDGRLCHLRCAGRSPGGIAACLWICRHLRQWRDDVPSGPELRRRIVAGNC
jgi:multidrug transporter EmrE-like cation transporter